MENQRPRSNAIGKEPTAESLGNEPVPPTPDTKMVRATDTPGENDPLWEKLGATDIADANALPPIAAGPSSDGLDSASNFTELSPSRILGKNLVKLGDYRLIRKIGEGAMGAVYKAEEVSRKRIVALKVLFPHIANNQKLVDRMHREGLVMGLLDHPNIIRAYAIDETDGCHFVAMEYVSGQSMQKWLMQLGQLTVEDSLRITIDCAKALAYAHANNVIHRDIKPDNILITKSGIVKVADLGMVKTHDEDLSLTQTGHAVGTPWYMPLEQARNAKEIDGRSDIYALGCTLYAFLTGNPPFIGKTIVDVIQAKEVGRFAPARKLNVAVPDRLDMILVKMTAKIPKSRYQNCAEVIKDLESLDLAGKTVSFIKRRTELTTNPDDTLVPELTKASGGDGDDQAPSDIEIPAVGSQALEPHYWYVQSKMRDGTQVTRKYTTTQVLKMLAEGTMTANARISHSPSEGFRSIATYKEFQGTSLNKASKQAADKSTVKYRNLYKKIEEQERKREEDRSEKPDNSVRVNTRYWLSILLAALPIGIAVVLLSLFVFWIIRSLR